MSSLLTQAIEADETVATASAQAVPVVELVDVARSFPGPPVVEALRPTNLSIMLGDYLSVIGPSGSGKSTLLHLLGLLDRPTSGEYYLDGAPVGTASETVRAAWRGERIGFVFQSFHLLAHRSVFDNVMLATLYSGVPRAEREHRVTEALDSVGMSHRLDFLPTTLSGGERQRVAIARAIVAKPQILLADEPTGNLDSKNSAGVLDLFEKLHASGLTLIVITHDDAVSSRAERRVRIADGTLTEIA